MEHYLNIAIRSIFLENMALAFFLGMCSFLACSKKVETAFGLGIAVVFVQALTVPLNNLILNGLLKEGALAWATPALAGAAQVTRIVFGGSTLRNNDALQQLLAQLVRAYGRDPVFLPNAVNCVILGGSLFMQERDYTFAESAVFGLGSGTGFLVAIVAMAAVREKLSYSNPPAGLRGLGLTFVTAGLISIAFMMFSGIQL